MSDEPTSSGTSSDTSSSPGSGTSSGAGNDTDTRPPLRRSVTNRKIAGMCGGLGRHLNVDPVIFRVLLVVFVFFGGASVLLYGLGWLLIPAEDTEQSDGQRIMAGRADAGTLMSVVVTLFGLAIFLGFLTGGPDGSLLLVVAVGAVFAVAWAQNRNRRQPAAWQPPAGWSAPGRWGGPAGPATATYPAGSPPGVGYPPPGTPHPAAPYPWVPHTPPAPRPPRSVLPWITLSAALVVTGVLVAMGMGGVESITAQVVLAVLLIVLGAGLVVSAWFGRARSLIGLGPVVTIALVIVSSYSIPLRGGFGQRDWAPTTPTAVASPYRLTSGQIALDLTGLDPKGATVPIEASVGLGELRVTAPDNVRLVVRARSGMGSVVLPNGTADGVPANRRYTETAGTGTSKGTIELTLKVGMGAVEVNRVTA